MEELDEFNEAPHVVHGSGDGLLDPLHSRQSQTLPADDRFPDDSLALVADNDDDDVIFTALTPQTSNHSKVNNVFG